MKAIKETDLRNDLNSIPDRHTEDRIYLFCPGCYEQSKLDHPNDNRFWILSSIHCINTKVHTFNGDYENPTISPSLLATYRVDEKIVKCCHSFINNGIIQYLSDCTHPLVNQTVPLIEVHLEDRDGQKIIIRDS